MKYNLCNGGMARQSCNLTYPNGKVIHFTYDKNSNVKTVTDWDGRVTTYSYNVIVRLIKTEQANKTVETRYSSNRKNGIGI